MTVRHGIQLADGRELFYFDHEPGADHSAPDRRDLPPTPTTVQIRWDPLFRDWSVIADHRQTRTYHPPESACPLCPSRDNRQTEVPDADYEVVAFENRFPSLATGTNRLSASPTIDELPFRFASGVGRCEVVCFTSDHDKSFAQLSPERARTVIDALADRTRDLACIDGVEYVFCFENRGAEIGVTLSHPHGQIYAYPFVPEHFARCAQSAREHHDRDGSCPQCEIVLAERKSGERVVVESEHWTAHVPFAARWPYEVRIVPQRHLPDVPALSEDERDDLARVYLEVLGRFDRLFGVPVPYIADWQQAPVRQDRDVWHLALEVFTIRRAAGKLKYLAGSESGAGVWINDVTPEMAAAHLRGEPY